MTKATDAAPEPMDRSPPIAFFLSAESFMQTATFANQAVRTKTLKLRSDMPVYYLYSHAIELTLKSFLRAKGLTKEDLASRRWGHDLLKLWEGCFERGLTLDHHTQLTTRAVIDLLAPYATNFEFRYVQTGFKTLPTLDVVCAAAEALQAAIKPFALATVAGSIPDRG